MKLLRNGTEVASVPVVGDDFSHTFQASTSGRYSLEIVRENPTAESIEDYSSPIWFEQTSPRVVAVTPPDGTSGALAHRRDLGQVRSGDGPSPRSRTRSCSRRANGERVSGAFSWQGNELRFTPSAPLRAAASYTATIGTGATSASGAHLATSGPLDVLDDPATADQLRLPGGRLERRRARMLRSWSASIRPWTRHPRRRRSR